MSAEEPIRRSLRVTASDGACAALEVLLPSHEPATQALLFLPALGVGVNPNLRFAAAMAQRLLGVAPPPALAAPLAASRRVGAQADRLARDLRQGAAEGPREHLHDILLCDRLADRLWARVRTALRPTAGDHAALPLPRPLWPLYWLTRPFRLAARTLRRS